MHNPDIEKFDSFLQQQLNHVEVDQSMADAHMNTMNFPVAVEAAPTSSFWAKLIGNKKFLLWSVGLVTTAVVLVLFFSKKETANSNAEKNTTTNNTSITTPKNNDELKINTNTNTKVNTTAPTIQDNVSQTNTITNNNTNNATTDNKSSLNTASAKIPPIAAASKINSGKIIIDRTITQPIDNTVNNTKADIVKTIAKADTALKKPEVKKVATPKDSTYIIW
jgi:hypothetical protein